MENEPTTCTRHSLDQSCDGARQARFFFWPVAWEGKARYDIRQGYLQEAEGSQAEGVSASLKECAQGHPSPEGRCQEGRPAGRAGKGTGEVPNRGGAHDRKQPETVGVRRRDNPVQPQKMAKKQACPDA